ncbi:MAG TPA: ATP-binding cassette domain-containing protein [Acidimicrobiales bacterium]
MSVILNELRASAIGVDVGGQILLNDVSLVVSSGQMLVITGASGSGKTILAHTLAGIIDPDRGQVTLAGAPLSARRDVDGRPALVTQDFGLISVLTAAETVSLPLRVLSLRKEEVRDRTAHWLEALGLASCANRPVAELSGGQRQRVAIARALAMDANVVVMDEPTAELDPTNRALLLSLLEAELARGVALAVVSHETDVIARADIVYELAKLR